MAERPVAMTTPDQDAIETIERHAEDIAYETSLTGKQAIVLTGLQRDADMETIGMALGRWDTEVKKIKKQLRQRKRVVDEEIEELQREKDLLDEAF